MKIIKKTLKFLMYFLISILILLGIYLLSERILSRTDVNKDITKISEKITIYVKSNGVHTDFVFPIKNQYIDWTSVFPIENTLGKKNHFKYIAIG